MRQFQYPAICTLSAVLIFFGCLDLVRSVQVVSGQDWVQFGRFAEILLNHAQEDCESEKESKSGEETESKESKKFKKSRKCKKSNKPKTSKKSKKSKIRPKSGG